MVLMWPFVYYVLDGSIQCGLVWSVLRKTNCFINYFSQENVIFSICKWSCVQQGTRDSQWIVAARTVSFSRLSNQCVSSKIYWHAYAVTCESVYFARNRDWLASACGILDWYCVGFFAPLAYANVVWSLQNPVSKKDIARIVDKFV